MKKQFIWITLGIVTFFVIIYVGGQQRENEHPTLNESAKMPDSYLKNVEYYEEKDRHEMSAFNLEKAIQSIWKLESDVDKSSFEKLESAIERLENVHKSIIRDSIDSNELRSSFEFALNNLAHAELEVSEMYAETNHIYEANIALKYAQLHVKNAMLFHNPYWKGDSIQFAIEKQVFNEMERLLKDKSVSPAEYTLALDKMIKAIDVVIANQQ
ncbi:hypothetical protein [Ekhidna sp.]|uniref:hypothetical protein n=1 Tax=Ekhidna sp. TaxID=2608089 RepID=UPI003512977B